MARIKIEDLPVLENLSVKDKRGIFGGATSTLREVDPSSSSQSNYYDFDAFEEVQLSTGGTDIS